MGERQLVALARAYVADPDLLVLDEATSAVDPATEVRLQRALDSLTRGRTTLAIAHRLSTAEAADEVIVVDAGVVVQRGPHAELVRDAGRLRRAARLLGRRSRGEPSASPRRERRAPRPARSPSSSSAASGAALGARACPTCASSAGLGDGRLGARPRGRRASRRCPTMPLAGRLVDRCTARRALLPLTLLGAVRGERRRCSASLAGPLPLAARARAARRSPPARSTSSSTPPPPRGSGVEGDRLMALGHGRFSVGVLSGGGAAPGFARERGRRTPLPVLAGRRRWSVARAVALLQPAYRHRGRGRPTPPPGGAGWRRRSLGLGALTALARSSSRTPSQSWSALHLERGLTRTPCGRRRSARALFAGAMAVGRFGAHALARPGCETSRVLAWPAAPSSPPALLVCRRRRADGAVVALVGVVVAGAGASVLAPTLVLRRRPPRSAPGRSRARTSPPVTALGYVGFVTGPALVGLLSDAHRAAARARGAARLLGLGARGGRAVRCCVARGEASRPR